MNCNGVHAEHFTVEVHRKVTGIADILGPDVPVVGILMPSNMLLLQGDSDGHS